MAHAMKDTTRRLAYLPRHIALYALIAVAIPVVAGIFALTAVLGTLALAGDFVRVGRRRYR